MIAEEFWKPSVRHKKLMITNDWSFAQYLYDLYYDDKIIQMCLEFIDASQHFIQCNLKKSTSPSGFLIFTDPTLKSTGLGLRTTEFS